MKKRKESDAILDDIRRGRREYLTKRDKKRLETHKEKINDSAATISSDRLTYDKEDSLISSKDYKNLEKTPCPKNLCLDSNRDETIPFLNRLPGATNPSRKSRRFKRNDSSEITSFLDFPSIEKICPASALIISSHYFIHKRRGSTIHVYDWDDWNEDVKDTLTKMGFFELLEFKPIPTDKNLQRIPIKRFKSGNKANNEEITEYFQRLVEKIDKNFFTDKENDSFKQTASAIFEAVENSVRHAYTTDFPKDVRNRWWFGGMFSLERKEITLVCYDKGMSIPKHIQDSGLKDNRNKIYVWIKERMDKLTLQAGKQDIGDNFDDARLELAMQYATSSTKQEGSGKGLNHIANTIEGFRDGKVKIMSRRAYAEITKNKPPQFTLLDTPIIGTLIIWEIRL